MSDSDMSNSNNFDDSNDVSNSEHEQQWWEWQHRAWKIVYLSLFYKLTII